MGNLLLPPLGKTKVYPPAPPANCVLYLSGYPPLGSTIFDRSGNANNGTITGATWKRLPSGLWSIRYDGNDYINIDVAVNDLAATTTGTWMAWMKLDDATPVATAMAVCFGDTNADEFIQFGILSSGKLYSQLYVAGARKWRLDTAAAAVANLRYAHITVIQDGVSPILLVNGVLVAQAFVDATDKTLWFAGCAGIDNGRIGCGNYNSVGNTAFITDGNTALTKIINTNLTVAQVLSIFNQELHLFVV